ncbi:MAG: discoidin domain-containing protein [Candidatus Methanoperedens sp.]|nr:discoidin domain-containing protein [Candidatus Methanoperedens sp.]
MTFDTVVFGTFVIGTGFTAGSSIPAGGLRCFIKPTANIGAAPFDVTITYIDQFGNSAETTLVSTSVSAYTTSGSHIQITLNAGDTGIQRLVSASVVGGTTGDKFNLESWNEGIGKSLPLIKRSLETPWVNHEVSRSDAPLAHSWFGGEIIDVASSNVVISPNVLNYTAIMETEIVQPYYESEFSRFGFLETTTFDVQNDSMKRLMSSIDAGHLLSIIDANEPSTRFKWLWNGSAYIDSGFYQIDFDFALQRGSLFTFEVLDKDGDIKFSRATNTAGWTTPSTIQSYCGQEILYPASNTKDGNTSTEWRHNTDEAHWIIYDLGTTARVGGSRIYWKGSSLGYTVDIYGSNDLSNWVLEYEDWEVSGAAPMWKEIEFIPIFKRYIKLMIYPIHSGHLLDDFMDVKFYLFEHQTLVFKSLAFEMRLRLSSNGTTNGTEYLDIRNIQIHRYKPEGTIESNFAVPVPNISSYDELLMNTTEPAGTDVKFQLAFNDNGSSWSNFSGSDGTSATYYSFIGEPIKVPTGLIGKYYKWKAYLSADGRETPIFDGLTIWMFVKMYYFIINLEKQLCTPIVIANPQMMNPTISLFRACARQTAGYPTPCPGGYYLPEVLSGREFTGKIWIMIHGSIVSFLTETLSGRQWIAKYWLYFKSWMESVVGQVVSGYVRDQDENIIINGIKIVITSSTTLGTDQMNPVNPITGFYQIFVKNTKYDNRYLLVNQEGKTFDLAYSAYGLPAIIDGTVKVPSPQDLHFWKPNQICGKSVAYVGSLVSY